MNTIRFFLLLFSIFFFAFIFRLQNIGENPPSGVLSEKVIQQADYSVPKELNTFIYPNAKLISSYEERVLLLTTDSIDEVLSWYYPIIFDKPYVLNIYDKNNQENVLSADKNGVHIIVSIKKTKEEKNVSIDITASTP